MITKIAASIWSNYKRSPKERMEFIKENNPRLHKLNNAIVGREVDELDYAGLMDGKHLTPEQKRETRKRIGYNIGGLVLGTVAGSGLGGKVDQYMARKHGIDTRAGSMVGGALGNVAGTLAASRLTNRRIAREKARQNDN